VLGLLGGLTLVLVLPSEVMGWAVTDVKEASHKLDDCPRREGRKMVASVDKHASKNLLVPR